MYSRMPFKDISKSIRKLATLLQQYFMKQEIKSSLLK